MEFVFYKPPAAKDGEKRQFKGTEEKRAKQRDYQTVYRAKKQAETPINVPPAQNDIDSSPPVDDFDAIPRFPKLPSDFIGKWCIKHTLEDLQQPPLFHLTVYGTKNILNFMKLVEPYGRWFGCVRLVPFVDEAAPTWDEGLKEGKEIASQWLSSVHRQTYEYPNKDGHAFDNVIQVRNLERDTRRKISTWLPKIKQAEGFDSVEDVVRDLVEIASGKDEDFVGYKPYGADQETTLINMHRSQLGFIKSNENLLFHDGGEVYAGIHTPYLYFGTPGTLFTWHLEDWLLPSANHLLDGAPKLWYIIPAASLTGFEKSCKDMFKTHFPETEYANIRFDCPQFIKHERLFFSGNRVSTSIEDWKTNGYKCYTVKQEIGHLVVIWPGVYHSGVNLGYNLAEAANFAHKSWIRLAETHPVCACSTSYKAPMVFNISEMERAFKEQKITKARCSRK